MRAPLLVLALSLAAVLAAPRSQQRIVGGSVTTIDQYPFVCPLLRSSAGSTGVYWQSCGGTLITSTAVLSAAHCFAGEYAEQWRVRAGSSYANSGGTVHSVSQIICHENYNDRTFDNDVAVLRTATTISPVANAVALASIAGTNYNLADNQIVYAIGWGTISAGGPSSEQLQQVQIWSVNQETCRARYAEVGSTITDNMLCSGWLDVGGRDQCQGDSGGPLIHNNVIVGVCSWGRSCALAHYPGVNARISRYTTWIQNAAV